MRGRRGRRRGREAQHAAAAAAVVSGGRVELKKLSRRSLAAGRDDEERRLSAELNKPFAANTLQLPTLRRRRLTRGGGRR